MEYFFVRPEDIAHGSLAILGDESKHIARVLRKNVGDRIFVTDGNDTMYEAVITGIGKTETRCSIAAMHRRYNEPSIDVTLAVSLLKNPARFDYLVEKSTELGVRMILPIICERTISQRGKYDRLGKIALSAMKQSGRSWLPRIQPAQKIEALINNSSHYYLKFMPHEKTEAAYTIKSELKLHEDIHSMLIIIGPEGGFSEAEVNLAMQTGFKQVSLGPRRLRTETAAVVAMSQLL
jgi:16S rRNA (uracil1498-N3)-methyltransferase